MPAPDHLQPIGKDRIAHPASMAVKTRQYMSCALRGSAAWFARRQPARSAILGRPLAVLDWGIAVLVWLGAAGLLLGLEAYLQNAHIGTTNGLWESIELRHWIDNPGWANLDFGNAIYLPIYGVLCQELTRLGIFPGVVWRQMAALDAVFAGLGLAGVYLFAVAWLRDRTAAGLTVLLYGGSGFYLLCATMDEWDMPSQSFILFATLLACAWFARPSARRIAGVAILFSISWLFEWRFLFPALPPLLLALFLTPGFWWQRIVRPVTFLCGMALLPLGLAAGYFWTAGATLAQARTFFVRLFWAGKGVGSGWGGFSLAKFPLAMEGIAESFVGGRNLPYGAWMIVPVEVFCGLAIFVALLVVAIRYAWRHRDDDAVVVAGAVLGGTLVAGTVFNLYSQPQDPQMLINVMLWTVPAWGLVARAALVWPATGRANGQRWRVWLRPILVAITLMPVAYNVSVLAKSRGGDRENQEFVARLGQHFDPRRTVFLYQGFEAIVTWQFADWDGSWDPPSALPPAPSLRPTFKIIAPIGIPVNHPSWNVARQVSDLKHQIDTALDRGYQVVAGPEYLLSDKKWVTGFLTVAPAAVPEAMRHMLEANFRLTPVYDDPVGGQYSILTRKPRP